MSADLPRKRDDSEWEDDGRGRLKGRIAIDIWRIFPLLLFFQEGNFFAVKRFYSPSSPLSYNSALSRIICSAKSLGSALDVGQKKDGAWLQKVCSFPAAAWSLLSSQHVDTHVNNNEDGYMASP